MSLSVNFIDCLIVLTVVVSAGYACWRGFIWETLTIFSWAAASICCLYFGPYIIPLTTSLVGAGWLATGAGGWRLRLLESFSSSGMTASGRARRLPAGEGAGAGDAARGLRSSRLRDLPRNPWSDPALRSRLRRRCISARSSRRPPRTVPR